MKGRQMPCRFPSILRLLVVAAVLFVSPAVLAAEGTDADSGDVQSFWSIVVSSAQAVGLILLGLSLWSGYLIIHNFWTIRRPTMVTEEETQQTRELIENRKFKECVNVVAESETMFGDVLTIGLRHGRHGFDAMQEAIEERAAAWRSRLFRRVEYLNIIGNLSPLLGLLGTVIGMIKAFGQMSAAQYGPENLAGAISMALVSTFLGLIVAIISLLFFGICRNRVDSLTIEAHAAVIDVLEYFRPAPGTAAGGTPPDTPRGASRPEPARADL